MLAKLSSGVKKRLYLEGCKNTETRCLLSFNASLNVRDETRGGKSGEGKGMFKKRIQCSRVFYKFLDSRIILQNGEEIDI